MSMNHMYIYIVDLRPTCMHGANEKIKFCHSFLNLRRQVVSCSCDMLYPDA